MKILVVGNGGREHAIAWTLLQSPQVEKVFCTPGNGGTATLKGCENYPISVEDFEGIKNLVQNQDISLVVVGPELPLALGITDYLQQHNIKVFGPNQAGAQLEASKAWSKAFMEDAGIPTAKAAVFTDAASAKAYIQTAPIVVKADGLAAGKGVTVATTVEMAHEAIDTIFAGEFGQDNLRVVVEDFLTGQEVSVLALTDGLTIRPLVPAQDHKQVGEGDTGPNTGGMGAYAPTPHLPPELLSRVQQSVLEPTLATLRQRGIDYRGVVYAGLMISPEGEIQVLEFNCRFGDPETQTVLALLETPLEEVLLACCEQRLEQVSLIWKSGVSVCVVLASGGYPGSYQKGKVITGIEDAEASGAIIFHAGTQLQDGQILTDGGRVLGVTAVGSTFQEAITQTYKAVNYINFEGLYYRRDIGCRVTVDG
ncbi:MULTISPECIES: phosphoribosylamine--glycine ligase [Planktothrix]|uniref:Phosphoribosylamine--glycine ligase n=2 Tax=Planktothrix TaxID=54304 RepID=A0A4P5ZLX9_PLAAG|nr:MULTISPECIES: phosphoribosylamine--glycine ligase [Planktothrix]CAD5977417.1 Phosphoribosylamine--glycine ligase [Planktothrix rubescens]CAC5344929.1 Phosphoribosylamine--glycine ligase [Planktothrix rubescens NIVA-CYA 18]CAD5966908.1 Phosphoribosylamine--glycine ligase [Planktothrix rubescens NIVA-CYA 18]CAH2574026.1 Phosphoribosylamine--glycine ligase [Planktothrix rubescens]GDZ94352.1 phosphoribosylamine--glycine ligase [Planktothrix agardhii CCAP 1459/11A]